MANDAEDRRTYDAAEAARLLGVSKNGVYEAIRRGQIPAIRIGKRVLVPRVALDRLLSNEAA